MNFLKKYFLWSILIILIVLLVYIHLIQTKPCQVPIEYSIGVVDSRFKVSPIDFANDIEAATHIWENSIGIDLFEHQTSKKSEGFIKEILKKYIDKYFVRQGLTINLIYDDRQKVADEKRVLTSQIDETKQSADSIKQDISSLEVRYKKAQSEYQTLLSEYQARRIDRSVLESKRLEVNNLADEVNALVKKYNNIVKEVNSTVGVVNKNAGQEFEEGKYISDASGERINIYEFESQDVLVRVLAHELGHALGLEHNSDPDSIMYYLNDSKNIVPTEEDMNDLRVICKGK